MPVFVCVWPKVFTVSPASAEQLEMDVITVYGKESYKIQKEVFDLLAPLRKEELSKMPAKKHSVESVEPPGFPPVAEYDTDYPIRPAGEVPTIISARTGVLLYFMSKKSTVENVHVSFVSRDGGIEEAYLKRISKDQYVEMTLPDGVYRMTLTAEDVQSVASDSIVIRPGQISLAIIPIEELKLPPPPPPKIQEAVEVVPPPAPPTPVLVRLVPLRKSRKALPEPKPMMVTKGRVMIQEQGLAFMEVRLYEKEVGFFDPYDPAVEDALLAVTVTDTFGNFEFPPIDNDDGFMEGTRDPVVVISLENRFLSIQKPLTMSRSVTYRYVILQRENVQPEDGNLLLGNVAVKMKKERPVEMFTRAQGPARNLPFPIRIFYPAGSQLKLAHRQLDVPANTDLALIPQYISYLNR